MRKNKQLLIIPDVHGRKFWKEALETGSYEKVIFLGDYADPYEDEGITEDAAIENFKDIIAYKQQNPRRVVLLLGNHDLHYYSDYYCDIAVGSRYSPSAAITLQPLFQDNKKLFQLAWETNLGHKHYLFSHAGITMSWFMRNLHQIQKPDATHLNRLLKTNEGLETLAQVGAIRWGPYPSGSIVWADSSELSVSNPLPDTYQIVGHTMQFDGPAITNKFACLDCLAAFSLNSKGEIKPVTEIPSVADIFY
jgi:hypothetical protein